MTEYTGTSSGFLDLYWLSKRCASCCLYTGFDGSDRARQIIPLLMKLGKPIQPGFVYTQAGRATLMGSKDEPVLFVGANYMKLYRDLQWGICNNFLIIPLTYTHKTGAHANIILVNMKTKEVERFDPSGYITSDEDMDNKIGIIFKDAGFNYIGISPDLRVCPMLYPQYKTTESGMEDMMCQTWTYLFLVEKISNPSLNTRALLEGLNKRYLKPADLYQVVVDLREELMTFRAQFFSEAFAHFKKSIEELLNFTYEGYIQGPLAEANLLSVVSEDWLEGGSASSYSFEGVRVVLPVFRLLELYHSRGDFPKMRNLEDKLLKNIDVYLLIMEMLGEELDGYIPHLPEEKLIKESILSYADLLDNVKRMKAMIC